MALLAIETSCDESAVAILDTNRFFSSNPSSGLVVDWVSSQMKLHEPYGGVVPELAAREHLKNLPQLVAGALQEASLTLTDIEALAVTSGPGLKGCLLVGVSYAKGLAWARGLPLVPVNHLEGHLLSYSLLSPDAQPSLPALGLLVSGGHSLLVLIRGVRQYEVLASTRDDAAGEAFDKSATLIDLPYPGGPALSKLATSGDRTRFEFPVALPDDDTSFSFSGLKTAVLRLVQKHQHELPDAQFRADVAAGVETGVVKNLLAKTERAALRAGARSIFVTGGVAANSYLRAELQLLAERIGLKFVAIPPKWCTDNAAMVAATAALLLRESPEAFGFESWKNLSATPRWPLNELHSLRTL